MGEFVVETAAEEGSDCRILIRDSDTEIQLSCSVRKLAVLQQCIERALSEPSLSGCQLGDDEAIAFSPHSPDEATIYRVVLTVPEGTSSVTATEDQLEEFARAEIQPILDRA
ncbi:hypothetical protein [Halalkalicoccus tibetensis]|uniref:Uncharacterized protein n=1 Tax=Halalkalicoccus tibetensis TaxID=175632 RepID=A0ABD5V757_9EURY